MKRRRGVSRKLGGRLSVCRYLLNWWRGRGIDVRRTNLDGAFEVWTWGSWRLACGNVTYFCGCRRYDRVRQSLGQGKYEGESDDGVSSIMQRLRSCDLRDEEWENMLEAHDSGECLSRKSGF